MDLTNIIRNITSMPPPQTAPMAPQAPVAPVKTSKLDMSPNLMAEGQKVFQPGGEHKQGSPAPKKMGTSAAMDTKGWAGKPG